MNDDFRLAPTPVGFANAKFEWEIGESEVTKGMQMKREIKLALTAAVIASVAVVGPASRLNHSATGQSSSATAGSSLIRRSVIKVHTDHGVITLPGADDSWTAAEHAWFVANGSAAVQIVNSEIPRRISSEGQVEKR